MDDAVKVQIEIVEFDIVGIRLGYVYWYCRPVYFFGRFLDDSRDYLGILFREPAKCGGDTIISIYYILYELPHIVEDLFCLCQIH